MASYRITRVPCPMIFRLFFAAGVCFGGGLGIFIGLVERNVLGIVGGMFLGLFFGLCSAAAATFYAFVFNTFSPYTGGLELEMTASPSDFPLAPAPLQPECQPETEQPPKLWEQTALFDPPQEETPQQPEEEN
ncbi:hypothetical protein [Acetonema longum]|uniref:Uncharacterized protein n=1 Tax=Acetonema longum DSM 6540 TaxID=1009370 RepID=F7NG41_9FIRM|nr:hypothetical protein [Acetonema longum]EGO64959.1 hypothetical protein ALO_05138 [Acetonema longum DSM 6540]